jgi:uncharacterized membrane protein YvbJ
MVMDSLDDFRPCSGCGMRFRVGDLECPQCGTDMYDNIREWAERLLESLDDSE